MTVRAPGSASRPAKGPRRTTTTQPAPFPSRSQEETVAGRALIRPARCQQAGVRSQDGVMASHEPPIDGARACSRAAGCPDQDRRRHA